MVTVILIVFIVLVLAGSFPVWPHSQPWGWGPSGLLSTVLVILLIVWLLGGLPDVGSLGWRRHW